jgi:chromosome segregation protein
LLRLKRVELHGFKSFCDRTEMRFNGAGLTAIVGPNGCGKSNLSDAISWVLGEQSAKTLRGSRMLDVIFAGTSTRKPLSMASVTLTLVDPSGQAEHGTGGGAAVEAAPEAGGANGHGPRAPREIVITRRLFRSGESEYLIDGRPARLRDIQDLFMGTGLGPDSYAIIEQGRIGQILSSKPQDRRSMIEEAAGISKFKTKRRLAEARLEGARQNLSRVFDILEEVGRQVNSLKRQASKAKRYQELHAELVIQLRRTLVGRFRRLERETAKTVLDLNLAAAEFQGLSAEVAEKEKQQAAAQEQAYRLETQLTGVRARLGELRVASERTRGRLEAQTRQVAGIEERLRRGEAEFQAIDGRLADLEAQWEAHGRALAELEGKAEQARAALAVKAQEREQAQACLREGEQKIEAVRQSVLRLLGEVASLKNELAQVDEYLASIERDAARSEREQQAAGEELDRLTAAREELTERLEGRQAELEALVAERRGVETDLAARKGELAEARAKLEQLRTETSRLQARKQSLEEILSHRAYTTESVKRFFTAVERGREREIEPLGVLADFVEVDPAYERAAEEFLHEELEYILVRDWRQAERGIELMRRDVDGRATFLVHPAPGETAAAAPPSIEEGAAGVIGRLSESLRLTNGLASISPEMLPRLARCWIVSDREAAQRLARQYPDCYFLLPDGVCYHGFAVSGGRKTAGGPLALKRELRELRALVEARQRELEAAAGRVKALEAGIAALAEALESLRARQQTQEKEVLALDHELRKLNEELGRASTRLAVARSEIERLDEQRAEVLLQRERYRTAVADKEEARGLQEEELEALRARLAALQAEVARLTEEHSALRVAVAEHEERRRSERSAQSRVEAQRNELSARRREMAAEMERLGVERARLLADNIELDRKAGELAAEIAGAEKSVQELEQALAAERDQLVALEESLRQLRQQAQAAQERRAQIEVALAERRAELRYLEETAHKELNVSLEELSRSDEPDLDETAFVEAEEKYEQLKARIEQLGPVNPQALEEYEEAQQRYDFLNTQRQDLLDSIRDTEKAIHEIDVETRKRFTQAFEAINENFREMFRTLFGGGMAEMRLTDESNAAESGIDIVASPPGKRLQNVLLLSGGEKALTALALLMAIFRYQPSPFCILDEVDAPLDEPNIQRLLRLLKQMSKQTQFILITHAKTTMAAAESLYGVTMQEPGVSRLVSVRLQPAPEESAEVEAVAV